MPPPKVSRNANLRDNIVPTVDDVARRAGVSTATVSRCLNSPDRVTERTRDKVLAAVKQLGYAPNFGARALAAKRTNTFGAIIPTMENAIFARGVQAFQEALGVHGITLLVASSSYRPDLEEEQIRALVARGADALLLIGYDRSPQTYDFLRSRQIPYVVAWAFDTTMSQPSIGFDNRAAMQALASEVIHLGHQRLGVISANIDGNDRARERLEGVRSAMQAEGLDPLTLRVIETPYAIANGAAALEEMVALTPRPTAILCGNDVLAAGALSKAKALGFRVPEDLSITGFDDIEICEIVDPPLTTVHVPHREMGRTSADALVALRNGVGDTDPKLKLRTSIAWRASLGAAPDRR